MRRIIELLLISIVLGLVGLGASSTREPWGVWQGFPFSYSYPNPLTCLPNPFNGCGWYYNPAMIALDYLFWLGISVVGVWVVNLFWNHFGRRSDASQSAADQNLLGKSRPSK
jgi:hypothetical protein